MINNYTEILNNTITDVQGIQPILDYWPSAYTVCLRLAELVLDIMPDPYGETPSMLHRCLIMGVSKWRSASNENDITRFKHFNDGLIKPLTELVDYRVVASNDETWDPFTMTMHEFCHLNGVPRVIKIEYRSDERFVINQRYLSFLMASRILSLDDVIALQALPSRALLSFG